jgi:hypothetical protein
MIVIENLNQLGHSSRRVNSGVRLLSLNESEFMTQTQTSEQAVLVYLKLSDDEFGDFDERESVFRLEDEVEPIVSSSGIGEYDGHEFGGGFGTLYIYGSDADRLFEFIIKSIRNHQPRVGSYIIKRYGDVGAREERINL